MSSDSDAWLMRKFFRKYTAKSIKPLAMLKPFKNDVSYVGLAAFPLFKMIQVYSVQIFVASKPSLETEKKIWFHVAQWYRDQSHYVSVKLIFFI